MSESALPEEEIVDDEAMEAPNPSAEPVVTDVREIEVPVRFELGSTTASLGRLESIQAGYVFELSENVSEPVTIRVNGMAIGRGELVRVGDRIGVRVVKVTQNASNAS